MKKLFSLLLVFIFIFSLSSCSSQSTQDTNEDTLNIVVTSFPAYEWTCEIIGEENTDYSITLLADGSDPHSFQPSAQDIIKITSCDILIYTGGTSDEWIEKAIDEGENDNLHTIVLMDVLSDRLLPVEYIPGMQHDHDEHDEHDDHDGAPDEHVWLSLTNAMLCTDAITDALCEVDENNKDTYIKNADEYKKELLSLDEQYRDMVTSSPRDTVLFSDRFPFTYLFNDYNLKYYAAFAGCSSQNEASFETV